MPGNRPSPPAVLSIAGSDSGGGAGIQADLKAFARAGVHGMTAITAITAQNTAAVESVVPIPPEAIIAQVRAVAEDIGVDAVKIGMLGDEQTIRAVEEALDLVGEAPIVLDPVMVAESGAVLLDPAARAALVERIVPPLGTACSSTILRGVFFLRRVTKRQSRKAAVASVNSLRTSSSLFSAWVAWREAKWQFLFPSRVLRRTPEGKGMRWHTDKAQLDRAIRQAVRICSSLAPGRANATFSRMVPSNRNVSCNTTPNCVR